MYEKIQEIATGKQKETSLTAVMLNMCTSYHPPGLLSAMLSPPSPQHSPASLVISLARVHQYAIQSSQVQRSAWRQSKSHPGRCIHRVHLLAHHLYEHGITGMYANMSSHVRRTAAVTSHERPCAQYSEGPSASSSQFLYGSVLQTEKCHISVHQHLKLQN